MDFSNWKMNDDSAVVELMIVLQYLSIITLEEFTEIETKLININTIK